MGIVEHFPFAKIFYGAFQTEPTEDDMFLQLASSHISQRYIIIVIMRYDGNLCILDINLCYKIVSIMNNVCKDNTKSRDKRTIDKNNNYIFRLCISCVYTVYFIDIQSVFNANTRCICIEYKRLYTFRERRNQFLTTGRTLLPPSRYKL